ncbi:ankyrin repeat domain-containing protein [Hyunsoonleella ulvae]|uniref:ankyrin repeat domain-containing protein n=1 Tax=Hyunsoonleella ulvae TaxID=2799948 RepID=UPI0019396FB6|nr:ankyrin repeat domain-containing protein [Hyunsoonleella ulvae]
MDLKKKISHQIELHSVQGIKDCFENGLNPNLEYDGKPLFELLISMYTRSARFKDCVKAFIDYGLEFEDKTLLAVLSDNAQNLERQLENKPNETDKEINLNSAYTPLKKASLLHVCAEFNHLECAKILVKNGIDVNRKSGIDTNGFGGQTPIFHTVNQNNNSSAEMMDFLLSKGADLSYTAKGIIWGENLPWETFIPSVNAISYAMFGLLPQMHRDEKTISDTVTKLLKHEYGINYRAKNIPNRYLNE